MRRKYYKCSFRFGYGIPIITQIGAGLRLPHWGGGLVIHNKVVIGNHCQIMQGVTIGNNALKSSDDVTVIGDNVTLCAGCKIVDCVRIGDNSIVSANAVVTKDVPAYSVVAGVPARVIRTLNH